jgi:hypothetical protein
VTASHVSTAHRRRCAGVAAGVAFASGRSASRGEQWKSSGAACS